VFLKSFGVVILILMFYGDVCICYSRPANAGDKHFHKGASNFAC
jgi:cbb3-type cytochrome oxidase subunit 3